MSRAPKFSRCQYISSGQASSPEVTVSWHLGSGSRERYRLEVTSRSLLPTEVTSFRHVSQGGEISVEAFTDFLIALVKLEAFICFIQKVINNS